MSQTLSRGGERERQRARLTAATLNALHELAIASGTRGVGAVARLAADHARALLGVDAAVVFSYDRDRQLLMPVAETESRVPEPPVVPGEGAIGLAFNSGLPVVIDDYQRWEHAMPESAARGMVSAIAVPLIAGERPIGALGVWTYAGRSFRAEEEQLLTLFAAQVAPALEAARLNQQRDTTARIFEALHELAVAAGGTHDASEVAALCVDRVTRLLNADGATLTWWDAEEGVLRPLSENGPRSSTQWRLRPGEGANGVAFKWKEPVVVADYPSWAQASLDGRQRGIGSCLAVPLIVHDRAVGTLGVHTLAPRDFLPADIELVRLLAAQIAPSLEAARLLEASAAQVRELQSLHELAVAAGGMLEPRRLASLVVREACILLGADRAMLRRWNPRTETLAVVADSAGEEPRPVRIGRGLPGQVFESGRAMTVDDFSTWAGGDDWARGAGYTSAVMVPLVSHQRPTGVLGAFSVTRRHFSEGEIRLLSLLAGQVAPALEAAELADSLQERARVFAAMHELAVAASGLLDPAELAQLMSERARDLLGVDRVMVNVYDPESGTLRTQADSAGDRDEWPPPVSPGHGIAGLAFERGATVRMDDYQKWPQGVEWARRRGFRSVLAMPLAAHDRKLGVITAVAAHVRAFTEDDERLLSMLVSQLTPALVGAGLHAELAASERALRAIYDTAPVAIARNELNGRLVWMNRAGRELFGYTEAELRDLDRDALLAPEDAAADAEQFARLRAGTLDRYRLERRYVKKDGSRFWGDVTIGLVRGPDGSPEFYYAMVEDVTERKAAEQALRESEERFRAVFDRAAIGIAHLDLKGRVMEANPALHRMLGHGEDGLRGRIFADLVHPDDRDDLNLERLASGQAAEHQVGVRYVEGERELWGNTIVSVVRDGGERPRFLIGMVEDVTLRRAHQADLEHRALHDPLTDLPNRSLLHDRLRQAILAARRDREVGAVLVIDLDGFKQVNDEHGHHCGDELLRQIGVRIRRELRGSDTVARLGGDEFAVVLPDVGGVAGAASATAKLTGALDVPFEVDGHVVTVAASIGAALFPNDGEDPDELMRRADANMYERKRRRR